MTTVALLVLIAACGARGAGVESADDDEPGASRVTHLHKKYRDELLSHYQERGYNAKVLGIVEKPVPNVPPFTPHDHRLWLVWSSAILLLISCFLAFDVLGHAARRLFRRSSALSSADDVSDLWLVAVSPARLHGSHI